MLYYSKNISDFCNTSPDEVLNNICSNSKENNSNVTNAQDWAWRTEIEVLQEQLKGIDGRIIFEFTIPRLDKRIDCVVLSGNCVFVLEFKTAREQKEIIESNEINQVKVYARCLKLYHSTSQNRVVVPFLVADCEKHIDVTFDKYENIYSPRIVKYEDISNAINQTLNAHPHDNCCEWIEKWENGRYTPSPTIIEAAVELYKTHTVDNLKRSDAGATEKLITTEYVLQVIAESKAKKQKSICFVTGDPGAGKTLVGLDIATSITEQTDDRAVLLSGNDPLVKVLCKALENDRAKKRTTTKALSDVESGIPILIQIIHRYRKEAIKKISGIENNKINILPTYEQDDNSAEIEHVVIFDEAQRAWDKATLCKPDRINRKSEWLNEKSFPYSEPGFLIWSMDLHKDWAVIVCLVGGGQEINTGEAGIIEWIRSVAEHFSDWHIYISDQLNSKEYAGDQLDEILSRENLNVVKNNALHLSASKRSPRAETLPQFIHYLLDCKSQKAREKYEAIRESYPLYITRNLDAAKQWLRDRHKSIQQSGPDRCGILMSSQAGRLRALGLERRNVHTYDKVARWFLGDDKDVESSNFLEVALDEFFVQGLELDWTAVVWDADFRYVDGNWEYYLYRGGKWCRRHVDTEQKYQLNSYRVLLTRARFGMVIVVPEGNNADETRLTEFYDRTFNYLHDEIGLTLLEDVLENNI